MITQWGMSDKLGPIRYGEREEMTFLNRSFSEHRNYSDKIAQQIDEEVRDLVDEAHQRCTQLLTTHWEKMVILSNVLLDVETVNRTEFEALMRGESPFPPSPRRPGRPRHARPRVRRALCRSARMAASILAARSPHRPDLPDPEALSDMR